MPRPGTPPPLLLEVGDEVLWKSADGDLPAGTSGRVVKVHAEDRDAECVFQTPHGPRSFTFALDRLTLRARAPASAAPAAAPRTFAPPPPPPVAAAAAPAPPKPPAVAPAPFMPPPPPRVVATRDHAPKIFMPPPPPGACAAEASAKSNTDL
jgi:hypothetical protein